MSCSLTGAESISVYEDVLRSVHYRLAKGSARFERRFRLSCSEMNGRYTSNELTLEVRPLHFSPRVSEPLSKCLSLTSVSGAFLLCLVSVSDRPILDQALSWFNHHKNRQQQKWIKLLPVCDTQSDTGSYSFILFYISCSAGELSPLTRQPVPPVPRPSLPAAVPPFVPSCRRAEWTHAAQSAP